MPELNKDEESKWSKASLRVFGDSLEPSEISAMLEIEPTKAGRKGEPAFTPLRRPLGSSVWILESPLADHLPLQDHFRWLLDTLEPRRKQLAEITKKYEADFFCGFSSANSQGACILDPELLSRLAKLGVEVVLDLYPPGPIEFDLN
jgi:hypothetical protein